MPTISSWVSGASRPESTELDCSSPWVSGCTLPEKLSKFGQIARVQGSVAAGRAVEVGVLLDTPAIWS